MIHLSECLLEPLGLENGVPSEHVLAARGDNGAFASSDEELWLGIGILTIGVDALGIGGFVFKSSQQIVDTLAAKLIQEALSNSKINQMVNTYI